MTETQNYRSPLGVRYASPEMLKLFGEDKKFTSWRCLWIALAKAQQEQGLDITDEQIAELEEHVNDINYEAANAYEKELRHDVMAHIKAYGDQAESAKGIIHLGATSMFVGDNTDLILMRKAAGIIRGKLLGVIEILSQFAENYADLPCLGSTHLQCATPTTVGKRATLWIQEFMRSLEFLDFATPKEMLGCRGATGSGASFMELFDGNEEKCRRVEASIVRQFDFDRVFPVSGQTYPRSVDTRIVEALAAIGQAAYKMANDIRLLQSVGEIEEPFGKKQVGSSAMSYKRNPMRSERICALARELNGQPAIAANTAMTQCLERTLDDSACRRMYIPESFLLADSILIICQNVCDGLVVYEKIIKRRLDAKVPYMAIESIIMRAVEKGMDRQEMHEITRDISMRLTIENKTGELSDDMIRPRMIEEVVKSPIPLNETELDELFDASRMTGYCGSQVRSYLKTVNELLGAEAMNIVRDGKVKV